MQLTDEHRQVLEASFLCRLSPADRQTLLSLAEYREVGGRESLVKDDTMALLLYGEADIALSADSTPRRGGPGRLYGAGCVLGEPLGAVTANNRVQLLSWQASQLKPPTVSWAVRDLLQELAELEHQVHMLDEVLRHEPTLRLLPLELREVLLQCATQSSYGAGEVMIHAGERREALLLLLRGHARLYASGPDSDASRRRAQILPEGLLIGVQDLTHDSPPEQPYQVEAGSPVRALEIPWRALSALGKRSHAVRLHAMPFATRVRRGQAHAVLPSCPKLGATALAIGATIALQEDHGASVALLDLDGALTAKRLSLTQEPVPEYGPDLVKASLGGSLPDLYWPTRPGAAPSALEWLVCKYEHVLVNVRSEPALDPELRDRFSTIVHLYADGDEGGEALGSPHQRVIHALRHPAEGYSVDRTRPFQRNHGPESRLALHQMMRVPWDPVVAEVYSGRRVIRQLGKGETAFGRASGRLARMLLGKAVGLALGGGGAWGFAHVGLLKALHEAGIPVDYVAGSSFGAVVGATWVARGVAGLDDLLRYAWLMPAIAGTCVFRTTGLGLLVDRVAGPIHHLSTEVPLLAVAADIRTAAPFVLPAGTLSEAVRASSGFPGLFAHYSYGGRRLVDGGVAANVPADIVHEAGADFILASNCIPPFIDQAPELAEVPLVSRAVDLVRSTLALMHRSSARDALLADHVFDAHVEGYAPFQFVKGPEIAERAYDQACREIPGIRAAYDADLSNHVKAI